MADTTSTAHFDKQVLPAVNSEQNSSQLSGKRILVVDDNAIDRSLVLFQLEELSACIDLADKGKFRGTTSIRKRLRCHYFRYPYARDGWIRSVQKNSPE